MLIHVNIKPGIERVNIDTDQIQQVILNLSINAIQAMPDGGLLKIEVLQKDYKRYKQINTNACQK